MARRPQFSEEEGIHSHRLFKTPTTSLAGDVAVTKRAIDGQDRPVLPIGHSYGGVVVTQAATDPKVAARVYIAAVGK
ncbi:MAG: alpha/beta hydrolase [Acidobacteriaceae bacterium]